MRVAVFSDVHGNITALHAVVHAIRQSGPYDRVVCAGDFLNKGPSVDGVIKVLRGECTDVLYGNHEEAIMAEVGHRAAPKEHSHDSMLQAQARWSASRISRENVEWLRSLDRHLLIENPSSGATSAGSSCLLVCHANPGASWWVASARETLETIRRAYHVPSSVRIVAFGHDHGSQVIALPELVLVNVSAVSQTYGLSPTANYTEFKWCQGFWLFRQHAVEYAVLTELARINAAGMPPELRTSAFPIQPIHESI